MQYLKDNVKEDIVKAALAEFLEKGYHNSSMRVIAQHANIVMGNIYRYFDNKEALYCYAVGPVYKQIESISVKIQKEIADLKGPWEDEQAIILIKHMSDPILQTFSGHSTELLILLDKSSGSKYENTKKEMIAQIQSILESRLVPEIGLKDTFILNVLASAYVEGICVILRDCKDHDHDEELIGSLTNIMLCQISKRI